MAPLSLDDTAARYQIRGYQPGKIQVNDEIYHRSIIISKDELITDWEPQNISELTAKSLACTTHLKPAILLIGTGEKHALIKPQIYGELINLGIGVEIMDTSAACRTFNALSAENREVVAALLIR